MAAASVTRLFATTASAVEAQRAAIVGCDLDFILSFADHPLPVSLLEIPRYGIWRFQHGDWLTHRGEFAGFWELYDGAGLSVAMLVRLTTLAEEVTVLRVGYLRAARNLRANAQQWHEMFVRWPAHVCIDIRNGATARLFAAPLRAAGRTRSRPKWFHSLRYFLAAVVGAGRSACNDLFRHEQWNVGLIRQPIASVLDPRRTPGIEWFPPPNRHEFLADPFGVVHEGRLTIFCECLNHGTARGVIIATAASGSSTSREAVDIGPHPPVHLSYPFLLQEGGRLLCIPETHEAREVGLYEIEHFPSKWKKCATLLRDIALVDATAFRHGEYWWLAASEVARKGATSELHLWYAHELLGPWRAHAQNPVKIDVRSSRPGGTPFVHEGVLYRPAQDCSRTYGGRIVINRVLALTPDAFAEEPAATLDPDPKGSYPAGLHTLSAVGDITIVDGKRTVFVRQEFQRTVHWMVRRVSGGHLTP